MKDDARKTAWLVYSSKGSLPDMVTAVWSSRADAEAHVKRLQADPSIGEEDEFFALEWPIDVQALDSTTR